MDYLETAGARLRAARTAYHDNFMHGMSTPILIATGERAQSIIQSASEQELWDICVKGRVYTYLPEKKEHAYVIFKKSDRIEAGKKLIDDDKARGNWQRIQILAAYAIYPQVIIPIVALIEAYRNSHYGRKKILSPREVQKYAKESVNSAAEVGFKAALDSGDFKRAADVVTDGFDTTTVHHPYKPLPRATRVSIGMRIMGRFADDDCLSAIAADKRFPRPVRNRAKEEMKPILTGPLRS